MARSGYEVTLKKFLKDYYKGTPKRCWYEPLMLPYVVESKYKPDFVIYKGKLKKPKKPLTPEDLKDTIVIEAKGYLKYSDRVKMEAVKKAHPTLDIRMLFQKNGYLYKVPKGKPRRTKDSTDPMYTDWAEKHGFPWAIGDTVPDDWLA